MSSSFYSSTKRYKEDFSTGMEKFEQLRYTEIYFMPSVKRHKVYFAYGKI